MEEWTPNWPAAVWGHVSQPRQETMFRNSKQSNCSSFGYWLISLQHLFKHSSFTFQQTGVFSPALQPLRVSLLTERGACVRREPPKRVQLGSLPSMKCEAGSTAARGSAGEGAGVSLSRTPPVAQGQRPRVWLSPSPSISRGRSCAPAARTLSLPPPLLDDGPAPEQPLALPGIVPPQVL